MKRKIASLFVLVKLLSFMYVTINMILFCTITKAGNIGSGGGGDADVIEFIKISDKLHQWIIQMKKSLNKSKREENPFFNVIQRINTDLMKNKIIEIEQSLNRPRKTKNETLSLTLASDNTQTDPNVITSEDQSSAEVQKALLEFVHLKRINCYGIEKAACTKNGYIQVSEPTWSKYSPEKKCEVVYLEMLVLMNIKDNRYDSAKDLANYSKEIGCSDAIFSSLKIEMAKQKSSIEEILKEKFLLIDNSLLGNQKSFLNGLLEASYEMLNLTSIQPVPPQQSISSFISDKIEQITGNGQKSNHDGSKHNAFAPSNKNYAIIVLNPKQIEIDYDIFATSPNDIKPDSFILTLERLNTYVLKNERFFTHSEYEKFKILITQYNENLKRLRAITNYLNSRNNGSEEYQFYKTHTDFANDVKLIVYSYNYINLENVYNNTKTDFNSSDVFFKYLRIIISTIEDSSTFSSKN